MTLPSTGILSMDMIRQEIQEPNATNMTLEHPKVLAMANKQAGQMISYSDLRGKSYAYVYFSFVSYVASQQNQLRFKFLCNIPSFYWTVHAVAAADMPFSRQQIISGVEQTYSASTMITTVTPTCTGNAGNLNENYLYDGSGAGRNSWFDYLIKTYSDSALTNLVNTQTIRIYNRQTQ